MGHLLIKIINFQPVTILATVIKDIWFGEELNVALYDDTVSKASLQFRTDEVGGKFMFGRGGISTETACGLSSAQFARKC